METSEKSEEPAPQPATVDLPPEVDTHVAAVPAAEPVKHAVEPPEQRRTSFLDGLKKSLSSAGDRVKELRDNAMDAIETKIKDAHVKESLATTGDRAKACLHQVFLCFKETLSSAADKAKAIALSASERVCFFM